MTRTSLFAVALTAAMLLPNAASAVAPAGQPVDGIHCDTMEGSVLHIHQHLAVFNHGHAVGVPEDVGRPLIAGCFYWLHTHTPDGIIHIESPNFKTFTLGNFFDIWGEPLTKTNVAGAVPHGGDRIVTWVDGSRYTGNPRNIELTAHLDVTIEVGPPYTKPAPFTDWNGQ